MARSWSIGDFALVWLGGFLGTALFFGIGTLLNDDDLLLVLALAGQYVGNLGVLWLLWSRKRDGDLGLILEGGDVIYIGLGLTLQIALALLFLPLTQLLFPDGRPPQEVAEMMADPDSSTLLKMSLIVAAVLLAPVTEELVFRGVLIRALENRSRNFMIVVSSAVFAAVHILGLDSDRLLASAAVVLPPLFLLGLVLAWVTLRTGRLGPAIFLHSGWNLLAAFVLLLPPEMLDGFEMAVTRIGA